MSITNAVKQLVADKLSAARESQQAWEALQEVAEVLDMYRFLAVGPRSFGWGDKVDKAVKAMKWYGNFPLQRRVEHVLW